MVHPMGPLRPILILLALAAVWRLLSIQFKRLLPRPEQRRGAAPRMGHCAHCGEFVPEEEGLHTPQGEFYCCPAHARAHTTPPPP